MDDTEEGERSRSDTNRPLPNDFNEYLPWACSVMQLDALVVMNKVYQNEYVSVAHTEHSKSKKGKAKGPSKEDVDSDDNIVSLGVMNKSTFSSENVIIIDTVYDNFENLIELRFPKINKHILPRKIFKIIGLIINFQHHLTTLTINAGLNNIGIHELRKLIPISNITDVCLDSTVITGANYDTLLEHQNQIRQLSLARCQINDDILKNIASRLIYPLPSSKSLIILNLSSNIITDVGAKVLAEVLRSNRQLAYLNLAGNMLTDVGAAAILDILIEFLITSEELTASRSRQLLYLEEKRVLIDRMIVELRIGDEKKKMTPTSGKKGKLEKEGSLPTLLEVAPKSPCGGEKYPNTVYYDKAKNMVDNLLGEFRDPFARENLKMRNDNVYCVGNNCLSYINFAYNNLSYIIVRKLEKVIRYQSLLDRSHGGLINVCIEGNNLPINCGELLSLDDMLRIGLETVCQKQSVIFKKKPGGKGK